MRNSSPSDGHLSTFVSVLLAMHLFMVLWAVWPAPVQAGSPAQLDPTATATSTPTLTPTLTPTITPTSTAIPTVTLHLADVMSTTQYLAANQAEAWSSESTTGGLLLALVSLVIGGFIFMLIRAVLLWRGDK